MTAAAVERTVDATRVIAAVIGAARIRLGLGLVKPGSIRWDGDRFTAEYAPVDGATRRGVKITAPDGKEAPESVKAMILAEMEAEPKDRKHQATFVRKEHKFLTAAEAGNHDAPALARDDQADEMQRDGERHESEMGVCQRAADATQHVGHRKPSYMR